MLIEPVRRLEDAKLDASRLQELLAAARIAGWDTLVTACISQEANAARARVAHLVAEAPVAVKEAPGSMGQRNEHLRAQQSALSSASFKP